MKHVSLKSLSMVAMLSLIAFSCQKEKQLAATSSASDDNTALAPEITTLDNNVYDMLYTPDVQASSVDAEPMLVNDGIAAAIEFDNDFNDESVSTTRASGPCNLSELRLSEKQIAALRKANQDYEACKKSAIERLRKLNKSIIERAEKSRLELLAAYKNGRITKEQLEKSLAELRNKVKTELADLHERKILAEAIKNCHDQFLRTVNSILTKEQWAKWVRCRLERFENKH